VRDLDDARPHHHDEKRGNGPAGWGRLGFVLSAAVSLGLLAARRITLRSQICFGPFLLGGALLAVLAIG
jgi:hypothetical protein